MKLYLSSYRIPCPEDLINLTGKPAKDVHTALIPNAKDYYSTRAQTYKINEIRSYQVNKGLRQATVVDLRDYRDPSALYKKLAKFDLIWSVGGNTFCLRQEMKRSGFDTIIYDLLDSGVIYAGDSAGAIVAGISLKGIETADIPAFAEDVIYDGMSLIKKVIIPHADNQYFQEANQQTRGLFPASDIIELSDAQALVVDGDNTYVVTAESAEIA